MDKFKKMLFDNKYKLMAVVISAFIVFLSIGILSGMTETVDALNQNTRATLVPSDRLNVPDGMSAAAEEAWAGQNDRSNTFIGRFWVFIGKNYETHPVNPGSAEAPSIKWHGLWYLSYMQANDGNDYIAYCLSVTVSRNFDKNAYGQGNTLKNKFTAAEFDKLNLIGYYAYGYNGNKSRVRYAAGQELTWQNTPFAVTDPGVLVRRGISKNDRTYFPIITWNQRTLSNGEGQLTPTVIKQQVDDINYLVKNHKKPSLDSTNVVGGLNEAITITDRNNALSNYTVETGKGVSGSIQGNKIILKITSANYDPTVHLSLKNNNVLSKNNEPIVWETDRNLVDQPMITFGTKGHGGTINLKLDNGNLGITKKDEKGVLRSGVVFELGQTNNAGNIEVRSTGTTNSNGYVEFKNIQTGTVYYREKSVPYDIMIDTTWKKVEIPMGQTVRVEVVNKMRPGDVTIVKYANDTKDPLPGAIFRLTNLQTGRKYTSTPTNAQGKTIIKDLPTGKYSVVETFVNEPYLINDNIKDIEIKPGQNTLDVYDEPGKGYLVIEKKDDWVGGNPLKDVVFKITDDLDSRNTHTVTTGADGKVKILLRSGSYTVEEIGAPTHIQVSGEKKQVVINMPKNNNNNDTPGNLDVKTLTFINPYASYIYTGINKIAINTPPAGNDMFVEVTYGRPWEYDYNLLPNQIKDIKVKIIIRDKLTDREIGSTEMRAIDIPTTDTILSAKVPEDLRPTSDKRVYYAEMVVSSKTPSNHNNVIMIDSGRLETEGYNPKGLITTGSTYTEDDFVSNMLDTGNLVIRTEREFDFVTRKVKDMVKYHERLVIAKNPVPTMTTGYGFSNKVNIIYTNELNDDPNNSSSHHNINNPEMAFRMPASLIDNYDDYGLIESDPAGKILMKNYGGVTSSKNGKQQELNLEFQNVYLDQKGTVSLTKNPDLVNPINGGRKVYLPVWLRNTSVHNELPLSADVSTTSSPLGINGVTFEYKEQLRITEWMFEHMDESYSHGRILLAPIDNQTFILKYKSQNSGYNVEVSELD